MEEQGRNGVSPSVAAQHNGRFSEQSTRQGSYEQNLTSDSAGPNRSGNKYVVDGQSQPQKGRMAKIFSNLY